MQNEILSIESCGVFFQLSAGIAQQGYNSRLHFMKWLKPVSFQLILPGSSWPPAARHARCWPCPCQAAPHGWKTLGGSCLSLQTGCPPLLPTNGVHPAMALLLSLPATRNPSWREYIPYPGARGGLMHVLTWYSCAQGCCCWGRGC